MKHVILNLLLLLVSFSATAGEITSVNAVSLFDAINTGNGSISVSDYTYIGPNNASNPTYVVNRKALVNLIYGRESQTDLVGSNWELTVSYSLSYPGTTLATQLGTLTVRTGDLQGQHQAYIEYPSAGSNALLTITNISTPPNVTVPFKDIRLELKLTSEGYFNLSEADKPDLEVTYIGANYQTEASWSPVIGAEEYDLEWVFLDDELYDPQTVLSSEMIERAFADNGVRVTITNNFYQVPMYYPKGRVFFRVRAVGRHIVGVGNDYTYIKYGTWSGDFSESIGLITLTTGFSQSKNWQYTVGFADDGKRKETISYADNSLRVRQTQTNLSTDEMTIVGETVYDFEGRPSLNILPAPAKEGDKTLVYKSNFNIAPDGYIYSASHFDRAFAPTIAGRKAEALADNTGQGASHYFSSNNTFTGKLYNEYTPSAEGFPISQVSFMRDGTGRVRYQGGLGAIFQIYSRDQSGNTILSDKIARQIYGTPSDTELRRLFGENVGESKYYKKHVTIDPNGQASVSYIDMLDRVVATALVGQSPGNVLELESQATATHNYSHSLNNSNVKDEASRTSSSVNYIIHAEPTIQTYKFNYNVSGVDDILAGSTVRQNYPTLCASCVYELMITIQNEEGQYIGLDQIVVHNYGNAPNNFLATMPGPNNSTIPYIRGIIEANSQCTATDYQGPSIQFEASFGDIGAYKVTKVVKAISGAQAFKNTLAWQTFYDNLLAQNVANAVSNVDFSGCTPTTCAMNCANAVDYNVCMEQCQLDLGGVEDESLSVGNQVQTTGCGSLLEQMKQQIRPSASFLTSFLSLSGASSTDMITIVDVTGTSHSLSLSGTSWGINIAADGGTVLTVNSIADLYNSSAIWQSQWEDALVKLHPEYCHYKLCMTDVMQKYRLSQYQLALIPTWTAAQSAGLIPNDNDPIIPTGSISTAKVLMNHDPFFAATNFNPNSPNNTGFISSTLRSTLMQNVEARINSYVPCGDLFTFIRVSGSNCTPFNLTTNPSTNANKWTTFLGAYNSIKNDELEQLLHSSTSNVCPYLGTPDALVTAPLILDNIEDGQDISANANLQTPSENCAYNCEANVNHWMDILTNSANCPSGITQVDLDAIKSHLQRYCMSSCMSMSNPLGIITENAINPVAPQTVDPELASVIAILANYSNCTVPDIPDATINQTLLQSIVTTNVTYSYFDIQNNVGCTDCDLIHRFVDFSHPPTPAELTDAAGRIRLLLGGTMSLLDITEQLRVAICTCNIDNSTLYSSFCSVHLTNPDNTKATVLLNNLHLALPCQTTISVATSVTNSALIPFPDPVQEEADCEDFLIDQATYNATQATINATNTILADVYSHFDACLNAPFAEDFSYNAASTEHHYTLYYYDQANSLVRTVPPIGVNPLLPSAFSASGVWDGVTNPAHTQTTTYKYDALGQIRESSTPDAGISRSWFDKLKRAHFSQDARQAALSDAATILMSYTRYDNLGRAVEVGELIINGPIAGLNINLLANTENFPLVSGSIITNLPSSFTGTVQFRTETVYGDSPEALSNPPTLAFQQENLRGRVMLSRNESQITRYDYDTHGNVRQLRHEYIFLGNIVKDMRYEYDLISGKVIKLDYQPNVADERFIHRYRYDADNRLTHAYTSQDGIVWDQDARYFYYAHGSLARVETGEDHVQGQDHFYNLQGWIKGINTPGARSDMEAGRDGDQTQSHPNQWFAPDAFAYGLGYYKNDYLPIGGATLVAPALEALQTSNDILRKSISSPSGLFNGNITAMVTQLNKFDNGGDMGLHGFVYQYDALNRIREAKSNAYGVNGSSSWSGALHNSSYTYDANGNIQTLDRDIQLGPNFLTSDVLTYSYDQTKPNQLNHVENSTPTPDHCNPNNFLSQGKNNYKYDAIGNLIEDKSEYIHEITWDIYGKVRRVDFEDAIACGERKDVTYRYDPSGNRSLKFNLVNVDDTPISGDLYVRDPQGNVLAIYNFTQNTTVTLHSIREWDIYGASRIGLRRNIATAEDPETTGGISVGGKSYNWATDQLVDDTQEKDKALRLQLLREGLLIAAVLPDSPLSPDSLDLPTGEVIALYNRTNTALDLGGLVLNVKQANGAQSLSLPVGTTLAARSLLRLVYGTPSNAAAVRTTLNLNADDAILWHTSLTLQDNSAIKVYVSDALGNTITGFGIEAQQYKNISFNPATYIAGRARPAVVQAINKEALEKAKEIVSLSKFFDMTSLLSKEEIDIQAKLAEKSKAAIATSLDMLKGASDDQLFDGVLNGPRYEVAIKGLMSRGYKIYEFSNHLGNVLLTLSDKVLFDGAIYSVNTISATDYQPFGSEMSMRTFSATAYRYGFNGKENDRSWGGKWIQDYGFRLYNPSIARFLSVDPLTSEYPAWSPYPFAMNRCIDGVDLDGLEYLNQTCSYPGGTYKDARLSNINDKKVVKSQMRVFKLPNNGNGGCHYGHDRSSNNLDNLNTRYSVYKAAKEEYEALDHEGGQVYPARAWYWAFLTGGHRTYNGRMVNHNGYLMNVVLPEESISPMMLLSGVGALGVVNDVVKGVELEQKWTLAADMLPAVAWDEEYAARLLKYNKFPDLTLDCSDVASYLRDVKDGGAYILEITPKTGKWMNGIEYGDAEQWIYHQVCVKGKYVYDPMFGPKPILTRDFIQEYRRMNPNGINLLRL